MPFKLVAKNNLTCYTKNVEKFEDIIVVIEGPSGVGKDTIVKTLIKQYPNVFAKAPSVATRQMRVGESEGNPYFFVSRENFEDMIKTGEVFEYTERHGEYRGMKKEVFDKLLQSGVVPIKDCDPVGVKALKKLYDGKVLSIFIDAPKKELEKRLRERGETEEELNRRMSDYDKAQSFKTDYDRVVQNLDLDKAVEEIYLTIQNFSNKRRFETEPKFEYRKLEKTDAQSFVDLLNDMYGVLPNKEWFLPISTNLNDVQALLVNPRFYILGAFLGHKLVGVSASDYQPNKTVNSVVIPKKFDLTAVVGLAFNIVHTSARGVGLMYKMCTKNIDRNVAEGYKTVVATVHPDNLASKKTLLKLGFELVGSKQKPYREVLCLDLKLNPHFALDKKKINKK